VNAVHALAEWDAVEAESDEAVDLSRLLFALAARSVH